MVVNVGDGHNITGEPFQNGGKCWWWTQYNRGKYNIPHNTQNVTSLIQKTTENEGNTNVPSFEICDYIVCA